MIRGIPLIKGPPLCSDRNMNGGAFSVEGAFSKWNTTDLTLSVGREIIFQNRVSNMIRLGGKGLKFDFSTVGSK